MLSPIPLIHLKLVLRQASAFVRQHACMDEQGPNFTKLVLLGHKICSADHDPAASADAGHTKLVLVDTVFITVRPYMVDGLDEVLLSTGRLNLWPKSVVNIENDAIQVQGGRAQWPV